MRADPFRQGAPFLTVDRGVLTVTFSAVPGDDALERWESEGGVAR